MVFIFSWTYKNCRNRGNEMRIHVVKLSRKSIRHLFAFIAPGNMIHCYLNFIMTSYTDKTDIKSTDC